MRKESQGQYIFVVIEGHPMADERGRILEHRYLMSKKLGRVLEEDEVVHHKDGNKKNNRISNLELLEAGEHVSLHNPANIIELVCFGCGVSFERSKRNVRSEKVFCSVECRGGRMTGSKNKSQPEHGTYNRYRSGCRCNDCRFANTERARMYR